MKQNTATLSAGVLLGGLTRLAAPATADSYAEDRALIENLQARCLFAPDFRDPEAYAATFSEDGVLDDGAGKIVGRDKPVEIPGGGRGLQQPQN